MTLTERELMKFYQRVQNWIVKNDFKFELGEYDSNLNYEDFLKSSFKHKAKEYVKYNEKIKSFHDLYFIYQENKKFGFQCQKEKYILLYGEDEGLRRFKNIKPKGVTLKNMILRHGEEEGTRRFKLYCEKQAYTNTFEYKAKKYGITEEEFKSFNKSRAVTLENQIEKYGVEEGTKRFKSYCERQSYTCTEEYLGKERYENWNRQKSHTLDVYIERYGEELGKQKLEEFYQNLNSSRGFSKISQELFREVEKLCGTHKVHYAEKDFEYVVINLKTKKTYKFDFVCYGLNLVIEFNGDLYHANPDQYRPLDVPPFSGNKKTAAEIWADDREKTKTMKEYRGLDVIVIWENDYNKDKKAVLKRIEEWINR